MKKIEDEIVLFGDRGDFAVQLGLHENPEKCKLCFWVQGQKLGSFTKGFRLKYSVIAYKKFIANKEMYFDAILEKKNPTEIRMYFIDEMFVLRESNKKRDLEEYERREKYLLFWGAQFTNDGSFMKVLYNNSEVVFIYEPPKKMVAGKYVTSYVTFCTVFEEYIAYCNSKNLA